MRPESSTRATRHDAAPSHADALVAERILRLLLSSNWRKGSLRQCGFPALAASLRERIGCRVREGAPVSLSLMAFPFKVPNPAKVGARTLPDYAELAAIRRLKLLVEKIRTIYAPGLQMELIHDGALIGSAFGVPADEVRAYERYFHGLLTSVDPGRTIRIHDFDRLQREAGLRPESALDRLLDEARAWWRRSRGSDLWQERFRKTIGMLNLRHLPVDTATAILSAAKAGALPPEFGPVEQRVHEAMIAYHAADALMHELDPRPLAFPDAIHATTRVQPGRLALWLVRRGQALLPWHGVGVIDARGRPGVATAAHVLSRADLAPIVLPGESTPFCFTSAEGCPAPDEVPGASGREL